jgi:ribosome-associated protein
MVEVGPGVDIPESELTFTVSGSGGPGGQHVNKTSSRVTLWFHVDRSPELTPQQKNLIHSRLPSRINKDGWLQVSSQATRSQAANRDAAIEVFQNLISNALVRRKPRRRTRPSSAARARRLSNKRRRSELKKQRRAPAGGRGASYE